MIPSRPARGRIHHAIALYAGMITIFMLRSAWLTFEQLH